MKGSDIFMAEKKPILYDISFSMINDKEYQLIVNAIKRQVDYYRNKVFNSCNVLNENALCNIKYNYKVYCNLYEKIKNDYSNIVKSNA